MFLKSQIRLWAENETKYLNDSIEDRLEFIAESINSPVMWST